MHLQERFNQVLTTHQALQPGTRVLLAVSGGQDSMVMMELFRRVGLVCGVAHCNFQLRAEASDADEDFVRQKAEKAGMPFFTKRFETSAYAQKHGVSTQMAARDLRYAWFDSLAREHGYDWLAVAHHLNDNIETALLNFIRGTGLPGIRGMREVLPAGAQDSPLQKTGLLRPLLTFSKDELLEFAQKNQLSWREDASNSENVYTRNFIRHELVPGMSTLNPGFTATAARNMSRFAEAHDNLTFLTYHFLGLNDHLLQKSTGFELEKSRLLQLPAPRLALSQLLDPLGFTEDQTRQLIENISETGLELFATSGNWYVLNDRHCLVVRPTETAGVRPQEESAAEQKTIEIRPDDLMVRLGDGSSLFLMPSVAQAPFPDGKNAVIVDQAKLQFPLVLRHWKDGDVFQPFGMGGKHQKLQDFFTNQKLSRLEKDAVWLLVNGNGEIIWVLGHRMDERFKAKEDTNALNIRMV